MPLHGAFRADVGQSRLLQRRDVVPPGLRGRDLASLLPRINKHLALRLADGLHAKPGRAGSKRESWVATARNVEAGVDWTGSPIHGDLYLHSFRWTVRTLCETGETDGINGRSRRTMKRPQSRRSVENGTATAPARTEPFLVAGLVDADDRTHSRGAGRLEGGVILARYPTGIGIIRLAVIVARPDCADRPVMTKSAAAPADETKHLPCEFVVVQDDGLLQDTRRIQFGQEFRRNVALACSSLQVRSIAAGFAMGSS